MRSSFAPSCTFARTVPSLAFLGAVLAVASGGPVSAQSITSLGVHPTSGQPLRPAAVSDNGSVVAGWVHDGVALHAIRWTSSGGMLDLGVVPGATNSFGNGISGNGLTIVGDEHGGPNGGGAFRWTNAGGLQDLGPALGFVTAYVTGVSGDGVSVIGFGQAANGSFYGYLWTSAGGMQSLDPLNAFGDESPAGVNRDGSVVVGSFYYGGAFRWSSAGGMQDLGHFPGQLYAQAFDVSDDGGVVVGSSGTWSTGTGWSYLHAFRWTAGGGMQDLGVLPGDARSEAVGVSGDGSIVVGMGLDAALTTQRALVWTSASGMVELSTYLTTLGVDLTGWDLGEVRGISADGSAIFGNGISNGQTSGWVVTGLGVPNPSFASLCDPGANGVIACPCANAPSGPGRGCNNSAATGGARITPSGIASLASDTLTLTTTGETPTAASIVLQGDAFAGAGAVFGQGVRCVDGTLKRMYVRTASGGSVSVPNFGSGDPTVSARSAALGDPIQPGQSRWYSVYYRAAVVLGGCPASSTYNTTQTCRVTWSL